MLSMEPHERFVEQAVSQHSLFALIYQWEAEELRVLLQVNIHKFTFHISKKVIWKTVKKKKEKFASV